MPINSEIFSPEAYSVSEQKSTIYNHYIISMKSHCFLTVRDPDHDAVITFSHVTSAKIAVVKHRCKQDFYFKTKTKTIFHVLEAPRDQDQGLETTSLQ